MTRHAPAHAYSKMIKYLHFLVLIYEKKALTEEEGEGGCERMTVKKLVELNRFRL